ncbi:bifunctional D-glycero-beta-D-manno-heptose-7-phosphate kinase/D-glycero-beta-D-manno-heptose 1-phosphate adenylyltransferase HldE [Pelagicoccus enzymogenes]|uniref:bifunctional D-glycero-beta-D-manno-heptose-7-phosphate kinase/D-glycero-beta-D-manno-heptose 1-phosphate adenylyltransferase HldE n=1 Tax=Pelagicoccus enzymogenes TaxID=2773457 RepID=UPI00280E98B6|nr:bifunctional D-glycero-beta-D-manno-heptose-7-phosphate kinase/D-glycero-beta-D-manno-heptose 1-phosphate adenylyltransferase HldE [Pelagicoccus enzymogenes]MDQ8199771.1 bifunctional D-glycero-beta-D-manno-heptose-7-phosphate kinase/D-glycero-beta-D-manno-heptose 1-phosphate adenylyltransferase HldE [Pelagicoccus enzymogenes]
MIEYIKSFHQGKVLICGDVMLDRYYFGDTQRISPEGPVPVVNIHTTEGRLGGAGNVALNVSALTGNARLVGYVGSDEAANQIETLLEEQSVPARFIYSKTAPTITKLRVLSQNQQLIRLDWESSKPDLDYDKLSKTFTEELENTDTVILSDYSKGTLARAQQLISAARNLKKPVLVDPKGTDFNRYKGASLLTPNLREFEAVVGHCDSDAELVRRAAKLIDDLELEALLVTRSEKGMILVERGGIAHNYPTQAKQVYDVTGAGDTVIATLALAIAGGTPLTAAANLANIAASIVVGKVGTATATQEELRKAIRLDADQNARNLHDISSLQPILRQCQDTGLTIVFTNGCFDVLHPGHVAYLEEAKALGDRLVVALNDDDSVRRLKGPERPINSLEARARVIGGLRSVDFVTSFSEDTPERIIKEILPDILVKGGDYQIKEIVGADIVQNNGGQVITLSFVEGCSTTKILDKIKQTQSTAS